MPGWVLAVSPFHKASHSCSLTSALSSLSLLSRHSLPFLCSLTPALSVCVLPIRHALSTSQSMCRRLFFTHWDGRSLYFACSLGGESGRESTANRESAEKMTVGERAVEMERVCFSFWSIREERNEKKKHFNISNESSLPAGILAWFGDLEKNPDKTYFECCSLESKNVCRG